MLYQSFNIISECFSPCGAETRIFQENQVNIMVADVLALSLCPQVISSNGVDYVGEIILAFLEKRFQLPEPSQFWAMVENASIFLMFPEKTSSACQSLISYVMVPLRLAYHATRGFNQRLWLLKNSCLQNGPHCCFTMIAFCQLFGCSHVSHYDVNDMLWYSFRITVTSHEFHGSWITGDLTDCLSACSVDFSALLTLCEFNLLVTVPFPSQRASNVESVPIPWCHNDVHLSSSGTDICQVAKQFPDPLCWKG